MISNSLMRVLIAIITEINFDFIWRIVQTVDKELYLSFFPSPGKVSEVLLLCCSLFSGC